jgi:trk system potassium uptake protein TrkA
MKEKQFLIVGVGRFGSSVAATLHERGHEVVVVDRKESAIEAIMNRVTHALIADATDEEVLKRLGVRNFDTVIVAIGENVEANILATALLKSLGAHHLVSKAASALTAQVLNQVGANEVIRPEHDMGVHLADRLSSPSILDTFSLGTAHGVLEIEAHQKLSGRLSDLKLPNRFDVQVIAVARDGNVELSPGADYVVRPGDRIVLIGSNMAIEKLRSYLD